MHQIQNTSERFTPLFDQDLFTEIHGVAGGVDPDPTAPRQKICRWCATEVFLWGIRDWWIRERRKGGVSAVILDKPDCPSGKSCRNQKDPGEGSRLLWMGPNTYLKFNADHARECTSSSFAPLDHAVLNLLTVLVLVNHMIDTGSKALEGPIAGPSHTSASTSGMMLNHLEPQEIAAN